MLILIKEFKLQHLKELQLIKFYSTL